MLFVADEEVEVGWEKDPPGRDDIIVLPVAGWAEADGVCCIGDALKGKKTGGSCGIELDDQRESERHCT
jgi:hypothetical protein